MAKTSAFCCWSSSIFEVRSAVVEVLGEVGGHHLDVVPARAQLVAQQAHAGHDAVLVRQEGIGEQADTQRLHGRTSAGPEVKET